MTSIFVPADSIPLESPSWLWPDRFPRASISIVEGNPGDGKSTLLSDIAARVSSGRALPGCDASENGAGVVWVSDEDTLSTLHRTWP